MKVDCVDVIEFVLRFKPNRKQFCNYIMLNDILNAFVVLDDDYQEFIRPSVKLDSMKNSKENVQENSKEESL